ncbi:MAG: hypothetical protein EXR72_09860 [Myxococcales bacterium]|nr:hypothetical protein [Myxococcales bacterium]
MRRIAVAAFVVSASLGASLVRADPPATAYLPDESGDAPDVIRNDPNRPRLKLTGTPEGGKEAPAAAEEPRLPTTYGGVTPGAPNLPPHPPRLPIKGKQQRMTWPGFQVREGIPTVFLQLTGPVEWSVAEHPGRIVYTLKDTTVPLKNNRRPLRAGEFGTAVKDIDARPKGRDVQVTIQVKQNVGHRERTEDAAGGFKLLVVELPIRP